jgi:hypothetical protein
MSANSRDVTSSSPGAASLVGGRDTPSANVRVIKVTREVAVKSLTPALSEDSSIAATSSFLAVATPPVGTRGESHLRALCGCSDETADLMRLYAPSINELKMNSPRRLILP